MEGRKYIWKVWQGVKKRKSPIPVVLTTLPKCRSIVSTKRCINSKIASSFCKNHSQKVQCRSRFSDDIILMYQNCYTL